MQRGPQTEASTSQLSHRAPKAPQAEALSLTDDTRNIFEQTHALENGEVCQDELWSARRHCCGALCGSTAGCVGSPVGSTPGRWRDQVITAETRGRQLELLQKPFCLARPISNEKLLIKYELQTHGSSSSPIGCGWQIDFGHSHQIAKTQVQRDD